MSNSWRWCLDLNIWCAAFLADIKGREGSACQNLIKIVQEGDCVFGSVQLVISWGMLNRLQTVLIRLGISPIDAYNYIDIIRGYASLNPSLTLGGTGVIPLKDEEDRHVLETALAAKAHVLVTANFQDFLLKETEIIISERYYIYSLSDYRLRIVHPYLMMTWLRQGLIPDF